MNEKEIDEYLKEAGTSRVDLCPRCSFNLDSLLHGFWKAHLESRKDQITKGRKDFSPHGILKCPNCDAIIFVQLIGDLEGFTSIITIDEEAYLTLGQALQKIFKKGCSTKTVRYALCKVLQEERGKITESKINKYIS